MFHGRKTLTFRVDFGAKLDSQSKTQLFQFRLFFEEKAIEFLCVVDHGGMFSKTF